ncbi:MAG TPA: hypothetical protein VEA80_05285 [Vitreimonas sp.]|uniref:hypothetical protein n=1 Tax=Vitreimonas sp. TaxID=3069702 RepID=UPI002D4304C9|nr:hypothetical protein [Vitreimonas sp.]HYD86866.1 hypothetical protein [Vitreimonas sp.]
MKNQKSHSQGSKTVEQRKRMLERKDDMPRRDADGNIADDDADRDAQQFDDEARHSEFPISRGGMNQEDRRHNKPHP